MKLGPGFAGAQFLCCETQNIKKSNSEPITLCIKKPSFLFYKSRYHRPKGNHTLDIWNEDLFDEGSFIQVLIVQDS